MVPASKCDYLQSTPISPIHVHTRIHVNLAAVVAFVITVDSCMPLSVIRVRREYVSTNCNILGASKLECCSSPVIQSNYL